MVVGRSLMELSGHITGAGAVHILYVEKISQVITLNNLLLEELSLRVSVH